MSEYLQSADGVITVIPEGMMEPVRCRCGQVYDLAGVTVTHRYSDCSMWNAPCCGRQSDDRLMKAMPDYQKLRGKS